MMAMRMLQTICSLMFTLVTLLSAYAHAEAQIFFVHTDHLGTPAVMTDMNQNVVWERQQTPFGETVSQTDTTVQQQRFPGQYEDYETGYYYNYFRDYDPSIGRYLQSDPIGLRGGLNTYGYVYQNPLVYFDPFGLETQYSIGFGGNLAAMFGSSGSISFGISIPDDWANLKCYQGFASTHLGATAGIGVFAGFGFTASRGETDGPLPEYSSGVYRYGEANIGWGWAVGVSQTGTENLNEGSFSSIIDNLFDMEGWKNESPSTSVTPLPHVGMGYGIHSGFGYSLNTTRAIGGGCECQ